MSIKSDPRNDLGLLLRISRMNYFQRMGQDHKTLSVERLASRVGVSKDVIRHLEDGIPNPERVVFRKVINALKLSETDKEEAYVLLDLFSPRPISKKRKRVKFHLSYGPRTRRHRTARI